MTQFTDALDALDRKPQAAAAQIVQNRMDVLEVYARDAYLTTQRQMLAVEDLLRSLETPDVGEIEDVRVDSGAFSIGVRPTLGALELPTVWPEKNVAPLSLVALPELEPVTFPTLTVSAPDYVAPTAPIMDTITPPGDLPALNQVEVPNAPTITLPSVPTLDDIIMPAPPEIALPEFDVALPSLTLDEPGVFSWGGVPEYQSDLWTDLLSKVLGDIRDGGTGLHADVETDLYGRHLDRVQDENDRLVREVEQHFAGRGFTFPPGALTGAILEIQAQISRNNVAASREITINQAELAQKNTHFMLEMGAKLEGMIREFFTYGANKAFEAAKVAADSAIAIYDSKVKGLSLAVESFKAQAAVYESRVRAALTSVEIYKAQVEGAKVASDVQKGLVEIYTKQVEAAETLTKMYASQMAGAKIASEIEMTKLEQYRLQTQAYIARLDGEKSKVVLFEALLRGETAKAETYRSQVQAFGIEVDAASKVLDARLKELEIVLRQNQAEIDRYKAELAAYEVEVRARGTEVGILVDGFRAEVSGYTAEAGVTESETKMRIEELRARLLVSEMNLKKAVATIEAVTKGYESLKQLQIKGTEAMMNVGAQLTGSALNAVNASASFGYSSSSSKSSSLSESHNFDHTKA